MLACAREIRTVVRQPCPVYLFSQTDVPVASQSVDGLICGNGCSVTNASSGVGIVVFAGASGEVGTTILVDQETGLIHVFTYFGGGVGLGTPSVFVGLEKGLMSETSIRDLEGPGYSVNGISAWNVGITGQVTAPANRDNYYIGGTGAVSGSAGGVVGYGGAVSGLITWTTFRGTYRANQAPKSILEILERVDK